MKQITRQQIEDRTREDGDCLIWTGAVTGCGLPVFHGKQVNGRQARRLVWEKEFGAAPKNKRVTVTCGCRLCVNPEHLKLTTRSEILKTTMRRADVVIKRKTNAAIAMREVKRKITMDIARQIRADNRKLREWAAELNCSMALVSLVRLDKAWREPVVNPWAGLGARAAA